VNDRVARGALAVLALAGAAVSGYLVWYRYSGGELLCTTGGCEAVQSSSYAVVAGVPVALLGLVAYTSIGVTALVPAAEARLAGAALALTGVAFSGYLLFVQLAVIEAVCIWCVANDVILTLAAAVALLRLRGAT
jgi:uncharacterized membrane protein